MEFGITLLSIVPVRKESNDRSEMTSQLLFGECFRVLEIKNEWIFIESFYDNYRGWVDESMISEIKADTYEALASGNPLIVRQKSLNLKLEDKSVLQIFAGSTIPFYDSDSRQFSVENKKFKISEKLDFPDLKNIREEITDVSMLYYNSPYLWGGRTPFGIDCSGFTQIVYKICYIRLPRNASEQLSCGKIISNLEHSEKGDLAFFSKTGTNKITHSGILLGDNKIIHSSGRVKIERIDEKGIYNESINTYTHRLVGIRNVIE
jgi:cell wall-associated NlpC family hydrolase